MKVDTTIEHIVAIYRDERDLLRAKVALGNQFASHIRRHCTDVLCKKTECFKTKRTLCPKDKALCDDVQKRIRKATALRGAKPLDPNSIDRVEVISRTVFEVGGHLASTSKQTEKLVNERRKKIEGEVAQLPIADFVASIPGLGLFGMGQIIAEAGRDLRRYRCVRALWKRMGVGRTQLSNGEWANQRRTKNKEDAIAHGYNPTRHAVIHNIGACVIRKKNSRYYDDYLVYKAAHAAKHPEGKPKWHDNHARRLMVKDLLADVYVEWKRVMDEAEAAEAQQAA